MVATEEVTIDLTPEGIRAVAKIAAEVNSEIENIGARRLQTVMEKLLEDVSFDAEDRRGETLTIDAAYVEKQLSAVARDTDLSKYVLELNPFASSVVEKPLRDIFRLGSMRTTLIQ